MWMRISVLGAASLLLFALLPVRAQAQVPEATDTSNGKVSLADADVTPPRVIYNPNPKYPKEARQAGHQGDSILSFTVGTDGRPYDIEIVRPLDEQLDQRAIEKVRTWRYQPALKGDQPVEVQFHARIKFRLYDRNNRRIAQLWDLSDDNDPKADLQLSRDYYEGNGVPRDDELSLLFLKMAADWNLPEAQFLMGEHFYKEQGSSPDYVTAYMWYALSKRSGGKQGEAMLKVLASEMSPEQLGEAETRVGYWPEDPPER